MVTVTVFSIGILPYLFMIQLKLPATRCRESSIFKEAFYADRSLTPKQAAGIAPAPGYRESEMNPERT
jgi:hypothetical protein